MTNDELINDIHTLAKLRFGEGYSINCVIRNDKPYYYLYRYFFKNGYIESQKTLHATDDLVNLREHIRLNYFY